MQQHGDDRKLTNQQIDKDYKNLARATFQTESWTAG
jgi:hypothetical protein